MFSDIQIEICNLMSNKLISHLIICSNTTLIISCFHYFFNIHIHIQNTYTHIYIYIRKSFVIFSKYIWNTILVVIEQLLSFYYHFNHIRVPIIFLIFKIDVFVIRGIIYRKRCFFFPSTHKKISFLRSRSNRFIQIHIFRFQKK